MTVVIDNSLRGKLERRAARYMNRRMTPMGQSRPMVSITFDDVPKTACTMGAALLESYGVRGTYYICGGLTDTCRAEDGVPLHSVEDLLRISAAGHEVGCHGYAHVDHQRLDAAARHVDIQRNHAYLGKLGLKAVVRNFAYPYGCASGAAKLTAMQHARSARGIQDGFNADQVDLALFRSTRLYESDHAREWLDALIRRNAAERGWLVFFTHAVDEQPGRWDCSPGLLSHVLDAALGSGAAVMTVDSVLDEIERAA